MCRLQTCQNKAIEEEPVAQQSDSGSDVDDIEEEFAIIVCTSPWHA